MGARGISARGAVIPVLFLLLGAGSASTCRRAALVNDGTTPGGVCGTVSTTGGVPVALQLQPPLTLELWAALDEFESGDGLAGLYPAFAIEASAPDTWQATVNPLTGFSGTVIAGGSLTAGTWAHLALVLNGTEVSLYTNGTLAGSGSDVAPVSFVYSSPSLDLGCAVRAGPDDAIAGAISGIRLWSVARSPDELIEASHRTLNGTNTTGLIGAWDADQSAFPLSDSAFPPVDLAPSGNVAALSFNTSASLPATTGIEISTLSVGETAILTGRFRWCDGPLYCLASGVGVGPLQAIPALWLSETAVGCTIPDTLPFAFVDVAVSESPSEFTLPGSVRIRIREPACGPGQDLDGSVCVPCPAGSFSNSGDNYCSACPPGSFSDELGSSSCTPCPPGRTSSPGASSNAACMSVLSPLAVAGGAVGLLALVGTILVAVRASNARKEAEALRYAAALGGGGGGGGAPDAPPPSQTYPDSAGLLDGSKSLSDLEADGGGASHAGKKRHSSSAGVRKSSSGSKASRGSTGSGTSKTAARRPSAGSDEDASKRKKKKKKRSRGSRASGNSGSRRRKSDGSKRRKSSTPVPEDSGPPPAEPATSAAKRLSGVTQTSSATRSAVNKRASKVSAASSGSANKRTSTSSKTSRGSSGGGGGAPTKRSGLGGLLSSMVSAIRKTDPLNDAPTVRPDSQARKASPSPTREPKSKAPKRTSRTEPSAAAAKRASRAESAAAAPKRISRAEPPAKRASRASPSKTAADSPTKRPLRTSPARTSGAVSGVPPATKRASRTSPTRKRTSTASRASRGSGAEGNKRGSRAGSRSHTRKASRGSKGASGGAGVIRSPATPRKASGSPSKRGPSRVSGGSKSSRGKKASSRGPSPTKRPPSPVKKHRSSSPTKSPSGHHGHKHSGGKEDLRRFIDPKLRAKMTKGMSPEQVKTWEKEQISFIEMKNAQKAERAKRLLELNAGLPSPPPAESPNEPKRSESPRKVAFGKLPNFKD